MIEKKGKLSIFLQLLIAMVILAPSLVFAGEVTVKPGKFDHFIFSIPEKIMAGEDARISLQAMDALNNPIPNFGETGKIFQVHTSGSASIKPESFKSSSFVNGAFSFALTDRVAEMVTLTIKEQNSPLPVLSIDLTIVSNKLNSFMIQAPQIAKAGERFEVRITAKDSFGNTVSEQIYGKNLNLTFTGDAEPRVDMPAIPDFKNGSVVINLMSRKTGTVVIEAKDLMTENTGMSERFEVINGPVNSFKLFAPTEVIAGESFEVAIVAIDRFTNVISDYPRTGKGVNITSSGKLKPFPSIMPAFEFVNGQAKVTLRYDLAEAMTISVNEIGGTQKGTSETIRVVPSIPTRFEVITPESAVAGQKFKIKVTAYNQVDHEIKNYNLFGPDIQLLTTGSGTLNPDKVPASEFVNGTAVVEVQYNKSESFAITAATMAPSVKAVAKPVIRKSLSAPGKQPQTTPPPVRQHKKVKKQETKGCNDENKDKEEGGEIKLR